MSSVISGRILTICFGLCGTLVVILALKMFVGCVLCAMDHKCGFVSPTMCTHIRGLYI